MELLVFGLDVYRRDYLHESNGCSNGSPSIPLKVNIGIVNSLQNNDPQTKSDKNGTVPNGSIKFGKEGEVSYSLGSPTMTIQPTAADNASFPFFGKVSSDEQTTIAQHFRNGAKVPDKFSPSTFTLSSPTAKSSQTPLTSSLSESRTSNLRFVAQSGMQRFDCVELWHATIHCNVFMLHTSVVYYMPTTYVIMLDCAICVIVP